MSIDYVRDSTGTVPAEPPSNRLESVMQQLNFRWLDTSPLGQKYGCAEGQTKRRVYHIPCRGNVPDAGMRLSLEPSSWTQFNSPDGSGTLFDVHLSAAEEANLSQLWSIDQVKGNLCLLRTHALGENWSLASDAVLLNNQKTGRGRFYFVFVFYP